ncbi:hypothetical protein [Agriterribacter sp.]|uniref:hypothetical protein n=1 Tax=Agriterribacter sp. TaxID=2821509 RepID=UPI002B689DA7|nr:hypothetical protein [Agriterribacter sp.]HTN05709.1 hypothetical protein [Agriterribacter sp.]
MNYLQEFISKYLNGKPVSPVLLKIIDFVLTLSLTSIFFQKVYFHYSLLDITDYKGVYYFISSGQFFIPLVLFFLTHFSINFASGSFFNLASHFISAKWLNKVLTYKLKSSDFEPLIKVSENQKLPVVPIQLDNDFIFKTYSLIKKSKTERQWQQIADKISRDAQSAKSVLNIVIKAIIATFVYYNTIPYFGAYLFSLVLVLLVSILILQFIWHLILVNAPAAIRKFDTEMTRLLSESQSADIQ